MEIEFYYVSESAYPGWIARGWNAQNKQVMHSESGFFPLDLDDYGEDERERLEADLQKNFPTLRLSTLKSRVLIGCEESQTICKAFRDRGFEAYSCDILPTRGNPEWHYQGDIVDAIQAYPWDLIIIHPDCSALANSGNAYYGRGRPRHCQRIEAIKWTVALWRLAVDNAPFVALENPVSVIFKYLPNVSYVQPWQHGHGEIKKTGFCLKGLPRLQPTNIVEGRASNIVKMGPSPTRKRDRAVTYPGIAKAIAKQWGDVVRDG